jgi:ribosomal protein S18 acetylase RimI-like enzyme
MDRICEGTKMTTVRHAMATDAATLAAVAAVTFPLACPPHITEQTKAQFIDEYLGEGNFSGYIADPLREVLLAEIDGEPVGYSMLVAGEPHDPEVAASITARPTVEISKCYVMPDHHGAGVASALMAASIAAAQARDAAGVWLGVNQENARANRFYEKCGFAIVGTKKFLVGGVYEDDFVRELVF